MKRVTEEIVQKKLDEMLDATEEFVVSLSISPANDIVIELDSLSGITIERCGAISKGIEAALDRDNEDFSIEVGSASLSAPFRNERQFAKHQGDPIVVLFSDGTKRNGILLSSDQEGFVLQYEEMIPSPDGRHSKRRYEQRECRILYSETKSVKYNFD